MATEPIEIEVECVHCKTQLTLTGTEWPEQVELHFVTSEPGPAERPWTCPECGGENVTTFQGEVVSVVERA